MVHLAPSRQVRATDEREFPHYYYSRTSTPFRYSGNGLGELYSADFAKSIDREYTVEPLRRLFSTVKDESMLNQMLYIDTKTWLPDDLLVKADKMTMANSLELRVPLLDHDVLEFAASLPPHFKLKGFTLKYIWKKPCPSGSRTDPESKESGIPSTLRILAAKRFQGSHSCYFDRP